MKILFEHDHLYYLPQFEPVIQKLKMTGKHDLFGSINISVPKIERDLFDFEMNRLGLENVHEINPVYRLLNQLIHFQS